MNRCLLILAQTLVVVVAPLAFCSCQTIQKPSTQQEPARLAAAHISDAAPPVENFGPQPAPGRPIATAGYYPTPQPHAASVAMMPMPQYGAACPCCSPRPRFSFSDQCESCGPGGACSANALCDYHPYDEYICDGGDNAPGVRVRRDWSVHGLDQEDTIVHFDTLRGTTEWTASNKVCLYAPRFAAVRQVTGMELREQADRLALADKALPPALDRELKIVSDLNQPQQPVGGVGIKQTQALHERQLGLTAETTRHLAQAHLDLLPYENFELIRRGVLENTEKPRLAQAAKNAIVWTETQAVQVVLDKKLPLEAAKATELGETVMYDLAGKPRMRIIKIADKSEAQPGDIVSFTLRFDNVGDQKVGNVTIIDNLTTRLEYVEGSQECSHQATFHATLNEGETMILRWEIEDLMRVGEGGIIRFKCRVR